MTRIRFPDTAAERRALGYLAGRFPFRTYADGETIVPEAALAALAVEGIPSTAEGAATYEQQVPSLRNPPAPSVQ